MFRIRIKKGETVEVISGADKGKRNKVLQVDKSKNRLFVQGVNMRKKHRKPNPQANQPGGIIETEGPIHPSNVRLVK